MAPQDLSWESIVVLIAFFVVLSIVSLKFKKFSAVSFRLLLLLVVFSGSQIVFSSVFHSPWDLFFALFLVFVFIAVRNVLTHNLSIAIGIAGVSSLLGISIFPETAIILLILLSFYDILAVYWTKHMIYLARGMMESGAVFGFVIPFDIKDIFYHSGEAKRKIGEKFMILGSGDISLPIVMASSLAATSTSQALIVGLFSMLGLFLTHLIFINQAVRKPMAALPPIATMTIIGYLVSQLL